MPPSAKGQPFFGSLHFGEQLAQGLGGGGHALVSEPGAILPHGPQHAMPGMDIKREINPPRFSDAFQRGRPGSFGDFEFGFHK